MTDTRDKIIEQLQQLAVLHFLAAPDMTDGPDPVLVLANARKALGADTWETIEEAAERVMGSHVDKIAEIEATAAREGQEAAELLGQEIGRTAEREAKITALEKELAERIAQEAILRGDLADACRDASAPIALIEAPARLDAMRVRAETAEQTIAQLRLELGRATSAEVQARQERDTWRELATHRTKQVDDLRAELEAAAGRAEKAERELAVAWDAYPSRGAVRGMVSLADVIEGLVTERDGLRKQLAFAEQELAARGDELAAALRPDGWGCALTEEDLEAVALNAYRKKGLERHVALRVRDAVLANLRRKAGAP